MRKLIALVCFGLISFAAPSAPALASDTGQKVEPKTPIRGLCNQTMALVKSGMTRGELEKLATPDGGTFEVFTRERYVLTFCTIESQFNTKTENVIKIDVSFTPLSGGTASPLDKIAKLSTPYSEPPGSPDFYVTQICRDTFERISPVAPDGGRRLLKRSEIEQWASLAGGLQALFKGEMWILKSCEFTYPDAPGGEPAMAVLIDFQPAQPPPDPVYGTPPPSSAPERRPDDIVTHVSAGFMTPRFSE